MHFSAYCVQNRNCCHAVGLWHAQRSLSPHKDLYHLAHKLHHLRLADHQTQQSHTQREGRWERESLRSDQEVSVLQTAHPRAALCRTPRGTSLVPSCSSPRGPLSCHPADNTSCSLWVTATSTTPTTDDALLLQAIHGLNSSKAEIVYNRY